MLGYGWPGNVRELKQVVHAAVLICGGKLITPQCLRLQQAGKTVLNLAKEEKINNCLLKDEQRNAEQIRMAVTISKGNLTQAAALLGISRPTLLQENGHVRDYQGTGLKGPDNNIQDSFPFHQRKIEPVLPAAFSTLFSWQFSLRLAPGKIAAKKNAAAIPLRFEG